MKAEAYVGITGFRSADDIAKASSLFSDWSFPSEGYTTMFGFLSSSKRLKDRYAGGEKSPAVIALDIVLEHVPRGGLPMIHYYTTNKNKLGEEIITLFNIKDIFAKDLCRAVQLNSTWPPTKQAYLILEAFPEMQMVLPITSKGMEGLDVHGIAERAREYDGLVRYVLVDPSGGKGKDVDLEKGVELMSALYEEMPNTRIGIAGDFDGSNVEERIRYVRERFPEEFCIDAEERLMVPHYSEDKKKVLCLKLDKKKMEKYIMNASKALLRREDTPPS